MKVKPFIRLLVLLHGGVLFAQDYNLGVRAQALGGSGVAYANDPEGQFTNPAVLTQVPGKAVTLFYSCPFGIKEITLSSISASAAFGKMRFGAAVVHLGQTHFNDHTYLLSFAINPSLPAIRGQAARQFSLGIQSALRHVRISSYEAQREWQLHVGLLVPINQQLAWGAAFGNFIGVARERPPRSLTLGLSYQLPQKFTAQIDFYKQSGFAQELRGGMEMTLFEPLVLRVGMGTNPDRFTVGLAFALKPVRLHFTTFSHFDLGWTQQYAATLHQ